MGRNGKYPDYWQAKGRFTDLVITIQVALSFLLYANISFPVTLLLIAQFFQNFLEFFTLIILHKLFVQRMQTWEAIEIFRSLYTAKFDNHEQYCINYLSISYLQDRDLGR